MKTAFEKTSFKNCISKFVLVRLLNTLRADNLVNSPATSQSKSNSKAAASKGTKRNSNGISFLDNISQNIQMLSTINLSVEASSPNSVQNVTASLPNGTTVVNSKLSTTSSTSSSSNSSSNGGQTLATCSSSTANTNKKKKTRTTFTSHQLDELEKAFQSAPYPGRVSTRRPDFLLRRVLKFLFLS